MAAFRSLEAAQDCSKALKQILEKQRSTAKTIQDTVGRAESELFTLQSRAKTAETQVAALQKQIAEMKAIYGRKEVDGIEILSNVSIGALGRINTLETRLQEWQSKAAAGAGAVKKFAALLAAVNKAFDPALFDSLAKEDLVDVLSDFADVYGERLQFLVTGASSLAKIVKAVIRRFRYRCTTAIPAGRLTAAADDSETVKV